MYTPFGDNKTQGLGSQYFGVFLGERGLRRGGTRDQSGDAAQSIAAQQGDAVHKLIQAEYARRGILGAAEVPLFDAKNLMASRIDIITKGGEIVEVKSVALREIVMLRAPRHEHKMQLLYYLETTGAESGIILYVARESPGIRKAFRIDREGEEEEVAAASITEMQIKHKGVSAYKLGFAIHSAMQDYKGNDWYARNYAQIADEARQLRRREMEQKRKQAFDLSYKQATMGLSEKEFVDDEYRGVFSKALRRIMTGFGSPFVRKELWKDIKQGVSFEQLLQAHPAAAQEAVSDYFVDFALQGKETVASTRNPRLIDARPSPSGVSNAYAELDKTINNLRQQLFRSLRDEMPAGTKDPRLLLRQGGMSLDDVLDMLMRHTFSKQHIRPGHTVDPMRNLITSVDKAMRGGGLERFGDVKKQQALIDHLLDQKINAITPAGRITNMLKTDRRLQRRLFEGLLGMEFDSKNAYGVIPRVAWEDLQELMRRRPEKEVLAELPPVHQPQSRQSGGAPVTNPIVMGKSVSPNQASAPNPVTPNAIPGSAPERMGNTVRDIQIGSKIMEAPAQQRHFEMPPELTATAKANFKKPAPAFPGGHKAATEMFLDIEAMRPLRDSAKPNVPGRIWEFATGTLYGDKTIGSISDGLTHNEIIKEATERFDVHAEKSWRRSAFLTFEAGEEILKARDVSDLVRQGHLSRAEIPVLEEMARRATFVDTQTGKAQSLDFAKHMVKIERQTTSYVPETGGTERKLWGKFKDILGGEKPSVKRTPHLVTDKMMGWFGSQAQLLDEMFAIFNGSANQNPGRFDLIGHNIQAFDMPRVRELAHIFSPMMEEKDMARKLQGDVFDIGSSRVRVVDTFTGPAKERFDEVRKQSPAYHAADKASLGGRGLHTLENTMQAMQVAGAKEQAHGGMFDARGSALKYAVDTHGGIESADRIQREFVLLAEEEASGKTRAQMLDEDLIPKSSIKPPPPGHDKVPELYNDMKSGTIKQLRRGKSIETVAAALKPERLASRMERAIPVAKAIGAEMLDAAVAPGTTAAVADTMGKMARASASIIEEVNKPLTKGAQYLEDIARSMGIQKGGMRSKGLALMGLGFMGAGLLISSFATSPVPSLTMPQRPIMNRMPIRFQKPLSADDQNYTLNRPEGHMTQLMRHSMTDFGSGYRGVVGSGMARMISQTGTPLLARTAMQKQSQLASKQVAAIAPKTAPKASMPAPGVASRPPAVLEPVPVELSIHGGKFFNESSVQSSRIHEKLKQGYLQRKRTARFRALSNQGTAPIFQANHHRTSHRMM